MRNKMSKRKYAKSRDKDKQIKRGRESERETEREGNKVKHREINMTI